LFAGRKQNVELALRWMRRDRMSQPQQLICDSGHCGDHRHYPAPMTLRLEDSLRHVRNSLRCSYRSAAVFLNYQGHVGMQVKTDLITVTRSGVEAVTQRTRSARPGFSSRDSAQS